MMDAIASIASSLSSATILTKTILGMKVDQEVIAKVSALQSEIMAAQGAALSGFVERAGLLQKIEQLEKSLRERESWDTESNRYSLTEFPTGVQVYLLKDDFSNGEPIHRICPNCFQKKEKSILQTIRKYGGGERVACPSCKLELKLSEFPARVQRVGSSNWLAR